MKKVLVLLAFGMMAATLCFGQIPVDFRSLEKKLAKSNKEIENPKKSLKVKTWMKRGDLMLDIYNSHLMNASDGIDQPAFRLIAGPPVEEAVAVLNGQEFQIIKMPRSTFYFKNGKLDYYTVDNPIAEEPLELAYQAFQRAKELDKNDKGKKLEKINEHIGELKDRFINWGLNYYVQDKFKMAAANFNRAADIAKELNDTKDLGLLYYYVGLANMQSDQPAEAMNDFQRAIEAGYEQDGLTYGAYFQAAEQADMGEKGRDMALKGLEKFPAQKDLLIQLINYYVLNNEDPSQVLLLVDRAIEQDPQNYILYYVRGVTCDNLNMLGEAIDSYDQAIALNPDFLDSYYNEAVAYYNKGTALNNEAIELPAKAQKEYDAKMVEAAKYFKLAIPPLQKMLEKDPDNEDALKTLRGLYFRFRSEPDMAAKLKEIEAKMNELGISNS